MPTRDPFTIKDVMTLTDGAYRSAVGPRQGLARRPR
jgi:hypothetical protein